MISHFARQLPTNHGLVITYINHIIIQNIQSKHMRVHPKLACFLVLNLTGAIIMLSLIVKEHSLISSCKAEISQAMDSDISGQQCSKICGKDYTQAANSGSCCMIGSQQAKCKIKSGCVEDYIGSKQDQINVLNQKLNYYYGLQVVFSALTILFLCRVCRKRRPDRRRQQQLHRRMVIARLMLHLNIWSSTNQRPRPSIRRSLLTESYISEDKSEVCAVCLDAFQEQQVNRLLCGHIFHSKCVQEWIQYNSNCPICRAEQ